MSTDIVEMNEVAQPGQLLKAEREKRAMTTKQIADVLNLPERFIIYLEGGDFGKLPGATFTRGYIRNYAKYFELKNIEELVALFDNYVGNDVTETRVLDFKQIKRMKNISNSIYWLVSFVVCLVLAGIVFLIWQHYSSSGSGLVENKLTTLVEPAAATSGNAEIQSNIPLVSNNSVSIPLTANGADNQVITNTPLSTSTAPVIATDITNEQQQSVLKAGVQEESKQDLKKGEGRVEASFKANCWVSITDATGKVLISKLFVANTNLNITGKAPLDVVLGAPSAVTLRYNGEPVKIDQTSNSTHRIKLGK